MQSYEEQFGIEFLLSIVDWISNNFDPQDVFDSEYLIDWAMTNGYIKEEDCPDE